MQIKTKFAVGDTVWTIRDCKAAPFEIGCIVFDGTSVYYGETRFDTVVESQCFATKEGLLKYAAGDGNENL